MAPQPNPRTNRPRGIRNRRGAREAVGLLTVLALVLTGAVTPAEASAAELARNLAAATLAEVTAAAAGSNTDDADPAPAPADEEVASATLHAGDGTTISAVPVDTAVTFGGKKSDAQLSVTVSRMPDSTAASAASETAGVVASAPVRVTAHDDSGADVTTIEADVTTERPTATSARRQPHGHHDEATGRDPADTDAAGPQGVTAVHPGVTISIGVDPDALAHVDPASLQIFTRENPGDPWLPLASHYDAPTQRVIGESGHLSQFVVIGKPYVAPVGPIIVLDPDDGVAHTDSPAKVDSELPYNIALANGVKTLLQNACLATVKLTREDPGTPVVDAQTRADYAAAQNPALTATLAFDAPVGQSLGRDRRIRRIQGVQQRPSRLRCGR